MAEPFLVPPGWVVWLVIVFVVLTGTLGIATVITGAYLGKWWLVSVGAAFCALHYLKVFRRVF